MQPKYDPSGNYLVYAGIAVSLLSRIGWTVDIQTVSLIIGGVVALVGAIIAHTAHKNLAVAVGAIRR